MEWMMEMASPQLRARVTAGKVAQWIGPGFMPDDEALRCGRTVAPSCYLPTANAWTSARLKMAEPLICTLTNRPRLEPVLSRMDGVGYIT